MRIKKQSGENYFEGITLTIRKEGDILTKSLGQIVRVYEVPGHDEGQLAIAPDNMIWFLAGDLIQTIGTVVIQAPEGDMKKYFESLERVIKLNPQNIIPSHGIIVGGIHKIQETLNHRKMREASIRDLLNNHQSEQEILESIYMGLAPELIPFAQRTIQAHIKKINEKD
jgi:glyoxylase-like metal-dependent hydrolase (beta-lactamase superfamily II)